MHEYNLQIALIKSFYDCLLMQSVTYQPFRALCNRKQIVLEWNGQDRYDIFVSLQTKDKSTIVPINRQSFISSSIRKVLKQWNWYIQNCLSNIGNKGTLFQTTLAVGTIFMQNIAKNIPQAEIFRASQKKIFLVCLLIRNSKSYIQIILQILIFNLFLF